MNPSHRRSFLYRSAATTLMLGSGACGYILYPERKGRAGGTIDVGVLIIDLLWLLPGLLPGAICLAVDFTTGCIYESSASVSNDAPRADERLAVEVEVDGDVVATGAVEDGRRAALAWDRSVDEAPLRQNGRLVFRRKDGSVAVGRIAELL